MMKRSVVGSVVLAFALAVAGCGSSSSDGGGGSATNNITGTISGSTFTQADIAAFMATGDSCSLSLVPSIPLGVSMAVTEVTNVAGVCAAATSCALKKSSTGIYVIIARAHPGIPGGTAAAPGLAAGTYNFIDLTNPSSVGTSLVPDSTGNYNIFAAAVLSLNGTCTPSPLVVSTGTLSVTAASATSVSGTVNLTLAGGAGTVSGNFTTSTCAGVPTQDACALLNSILGGTGGIGNSNCNASNTTCT
jgi:hypothetical protein